MHLFNTQEGAWVSLDKPAAARQKDTILTQRLQPPNPALAYLCYLLARFSA